MIHPGDSVNRYQLAAPSAILSNTYSAEDVVTHTSVLVTAWPTVHLDSTQEQEAFTREAQALVQLRHPHIVSVIDYGTAGFPYLVTEQPAYRNALRAALSLPYTQALVVISQVGQALAYAHSQGVLHRQLSPERILLTSDQQALVTGFGLETILHAAVPSLLEQAQFYPYMAPELLQGASADALSDQYSLGALAYEMFTGLQPSIAAAPLPRFHPMLPPALEGVLLKALAPRREERYESVEAFVTAFSSIASTSSALAGAAVSAASPSQESPFYDRVDADEEIVLNQLASGAPEAVKIRFAAPVNDSSRQPVLLRERRWKAPVLLLCVLVLIGSVLVLPEALSFLNTATVTITPVTRNITSAYTINLVTQGAEDVQKHQVAARLISSTSDGVTNTVLATGRGHQNATSSIGTLIFSGAGRHLTVAAGEIIPDLQGHQFMLDVGFSINPGVVRAAPAHAIQPGVGSNIPAYAINGLYNVLDSSTHRFITSVFVQNTAAFSAGQNAYDYSFVQQSDIDSVIRPLMSSLIPATRFQTLRALRPYEQVLDDVACAPNIQIDHPANTRATQATIRSSVTCRAWAYNPVEMRTVAAQLLLHDVSSRLGPHYMLTDGLRTGNPNVERNRATGAVYPFLVTASGTWVYQFGTAQQRRLGQEIAGKPQRDVVSWLRMQEGVQDAQITMSIAALARLPASPEHIHVVILSTGVSVSESKVVPGEN